MKLTLLYSTLHIFGQRKYSPFLIDPSLPRVFRERHVAQEGYLSTIVLFTKSEIRFDHTRVETKERKQTVAVVGGD